jgi:hypothetical protein
MEVKMNIIQEEVKASQEEVKARMDSNQEEMKAIRGEI